MVPEIEDFDHDESIETLFEAVDAVEMLLEAVDAA